MRTVDDVIRECGDTIDDVAHEVIRLRDRLRELEAQQAASEPVAWALMRGDVPVDGFPPTFVLPTDAFELQRVFRAEFVALYTHPTTPTRGSDE